MLTAFAKEDAPHRARRLDALRRLDVLDSEPGAAFDGLAALAVEALHAESAWINVVDADRQFTVSVSSAAGRCEAREAPLTHSFCRFVVEGDDVLAVEDARTDPQLREHPLTLDGSVVSYLGAPIRVREGVPVGSFCIAGRAARVWSEEDAALVRRFADLVALMLQQRAELRTQDRLLDAAGGSPVFVTDRAGAVAYWSRDCERVFGWPAAAALNQPVHTLLDMGPENADGTIVLRHRDGTHLRVRLRHEKLADENGDTRAAHTVHECVGVPIADEGADEPASARAPSARSRGDTLQILQTISELVVRELEKR